ncbi:hypothetical protein BDM02DRAFT_985633 [Thelephora ganbajun]|uniref:Uncharacterized protein n=1 Tax=Thelephora ganbajun TaxID=370292 RepID=A0ACB6Z4S6_THEGA|nr:hypothetical protein BDM02DRAFT_985633 [Thelephora ganbajun]
MAYQSTSSTGAAHPFWRFSQGSTAHSDINLRSQYRIMNVGARTPKNYLTSALAFFVVPRLTRRVTWGITKNRRTATHGWNFYTISGVAGVVHPFGVWVDHTAIDH